MKKGQKRMFKFLNKAFKNAIILQQLRIDELKLRKDWEANVPKVTSEQKFPSGGATERRAKADWERKFRSDGYTNGILLKKEKAESLLKPFKKAMRIEDECDCESCKIESEILKHANKNDV